MQIKVDTYNVWRLHLSGHSTSCVTCVIPLYIRAFIIHCDWLIPLLYTTGPILTENRTPDSENKGKQGVTLLYYSLCYINIMHHSVHIIRASPFSCDHQMTPHVWIRLVLIRLHTEIGHSAMQALTTGTSCHKSFVNWIHCLVSRKN